MRVLRALFFLVSAAAWLPLSASPALAQAPVAGPVILRVPASARTAALGNAWVAGRDQDVIFHNPAQLIGTRSTFDISITRLGPASTMTSIGSVFAAGKWSATFGLGAQILGFDADAVNTYPFSPDVLLAEGSRTGTSTLLTGGAATLIKGFRVGIAAKYVSETAANGPAVLNPVRVNEHALLFDAGIARNLLGGAAAIAVQHIRSAKQFSFGWSRVRQAGPLDLALFTQVGIRKAWTTPAAGLEVGYGWIEGYNVALRVGGKRSETAAEKPLALGLAINADRLVLEYAVRFFDGGRTANGVTIRWR